MVFRHEADKTGTRRAAALFYVMFKEVNGGGRIELPVPGTGDYTCEGRGFPAAWIRCAVNREVDDEQLGIEVARVWVPCVHNAVDRRIGNLNGRRESISKNGRCRHLPDMGKTNARLALVARLRSTRLFIDGCLNPKRNCFSEVLQDRAPPLKISSFVTAGDVIIQYAPEQMMNFAISPVMGVAASAAYLGGHARREGKSNADTLFSRRAEE
jgi:hypothetical protein